MLQRLTARLASWLCSPRAPLHIVVIAVVLTLPSLGNGLAADDYWHRIALTNDAAWTGFTKPWWQLFVFYDGDPARTHRIMDVGLTTWWADPNVTAAFFRPVTAATHMLDYTLWPSHPALMHAQSIAWYAALVAVAAWLYRRLLARRDAGRSTGWVAGLAGLLYAVDHNHGIPVGWIANRNAIVVGFFALASLATYDVAVRGKRADGERGPHVIAWALGSALLFALALGAGEGALAAGGFFVAHAVFLDSRSWRAKLGLLAPHGVAVAVWAVMYRAGGYGVRGSGMYVEPLREPVQYAAAIVKHLPLLFVSELGGLTPDLYTFVPLRAKVAFFIAAVAFLVWSAAALMRVLRIDSMARFFMTGALLGLLPACATFPAGRLLVVPGFGIIGLVALIGAGVLDGATWVPSAATGRRRWVRSFALWACGAHLLLSPFVLQIGLRQLVILNQIIARIGVDLPMAPVPGLQRIVLMNVPDTVFAPYIFLGRSAGGENAPLTMPARLLTVAGAARTVDLRRVDEHTVIVHVEHGFYRTGSELVTRNENVPLAAGSKIVLTDVTIEVLRASPDGVPTEASFRFDERADSGAYLWAQWDGTRLVKVSPPPIGEHVTIAPHLPAFY